MKINDYNATLDEKMSEFDMWVTPSLGEIRDTPQFRVNLEQLKKGFDYMADITENFADVSHCSSSALAVNVLSYLSGENDDTAKDILDSICNVLLLATGKTDNNLKCQFPLMLKNQIGISTYPQKISGGRWRDKAIPRAFSMTDVTKIIVQLAGKDDYRIVFVESYFHLIVSDEDYAKQLWSLGNAYVSQKELDNADALISSIVIFQSRGSITATQGHIPETILRKYMTDWGLNAGTDFNTQDVEVGEILGDLPVDNKIKKRKYDFIVPFQSRRLGAKVFIQSQFYAGDSGSVSHKVVDQTDSTREVTLQKYPDAVFVEYLDGAGYFSSLNGDLRKMLAKPTTKDFIQIRTAPLKLRRALQGILFLTPLEIEHAVIRTSGKENEIYQMFDEGTFVDANYSVDVSKCIIICTTNYRTEEEAEKYLGTPIYSRFSKVVIFNPISVDDKLKIARKCYAGLMAQVDAEDKALIENNSVLSLFERVIKEGAYPNMRMLRNDIEDAINFEILKARGIIQ